MDLTVAPVRLGHQWTLVRKTACTKCAKLTELTTPVGASRWLRRFQSDAESLDGVRKMFFYLSIHAPHLQLSPAAEPLATLAQLLEAGEFHVCSCAAKNGGGAGSGGGGGSSNAAAAPKKAEPSSTPRQDAAAAAQARNNQSAALDDTDAGSILSPGVDAAAIAQAQKMAAKLGVPFCEECLKSALSRAAAGA